MAYAFVCRVFKILFYRIESTPINIILRLKNEVWKAKLHPFTAIHLSAVCLIGPVSAVYSWKKISFESHLTCQVQNKGKTKYWQLTRKGTAMSFYCS
jgi:hypothetical protein